MAETEDFETFYLEIPYEAQALHFFDEVWVFSAVREFNSNGLEAYRLYLERVTLKSSGPVDVHVKVYLLSTNSENKEEENLIGEGLHSFYDNHEKNMIAVYGKTGMCDKDHLKIVMKKELLDDTRECVSLRKILTTGGSSGLSDDTQMDFDIKRLSTDLTDLLETGHLSDVEIKSGDKTILAHKCILSARSSALKNKLNGNTSSLEIQDFRFETVDIFVRYLYSGKLPAMSLECARDIYRLAHKYAVIPLKRKASIILFANLSHENVIETLCLAEQLDDAELKERATVYVTENDVIFSERWEGFSENNTRLANEVYRRFVEKNKNKVLSSEEDFKHDKEYIEIKKNKNVGIWKSIFN